MNDTENKSGSLELGVATRYFYRCPIAALFMKKNHGLKLETEGGEELTIVDLAYAVLVNHFPIGPAYIRHESVPLLQPIVGDLMIGPRIRCVEPFFVDRQMLDNPSYDERVLLTGQIVMRNNLAWITPETEDA